LCRDSLGLATVLGTTYPFHFASSQSPTPPINGVFVPEYKGTPKLQPGQTPLTPLQTELVGPLDISRLHPGSPVLAKLDVAWTGLGCQLSAGSILTGHIAEVDLRTKQNRTSRATVLFDNADCNGAHSVPFPTALVAVLAGTLGGDPGLAQGQPLADAVGLRVAGGVRSAIAASSITDYSPVAIRKLPSQVHPGQVVGLSRIKLSVATGLDGGSVLSSPNHDLRLESTTHLILMPRSLTPATQASATAATPPVLTPSSSPNGPPPNVASASPLEPIDETEVCTTECSNVADLPISTPVKAASLSTASFGYSPKDKREVTSFSNDASLIYLDAQNLIFTFDPHKLRERGGGVLKESTRTVRAVLIDPSSQRIKRILDWRVQGEGRYIWHVGTDRLLVHLGHQLRLFGPDLNPIRSVSLPPGPLAWISAAPSGNHLAVGIYQERHSPDVHRLLIDATGEEPEEDIDVYVYDCDLKLLLTAPRSAEAYAPVLSDEGEIRVHSQGRERWRISEYRWDRTECTIARATSKCRPRISASFSGYLFVVGCESSSGIHWYRMLRHDGHPVLKAVSPSEEIEQAFSSVSSQEFAVRVVKVVRAMMPGQPFHKSDLQREEISVYRASDGHRLFSTDAAEVPLVEQSFALSPNGQQIALIGDSSINFYAVQSSPLP